MTVSLQSTWRVVRDLPEIVKFVGAIITIIAVLATISGSVRAGLQVPGKLDSHMRQADTIIYELREQRKVMREQLCVTEWPRSEWVARCFAAGRTP